MGFYFRKGIKVGPLRFNLSKSGVGVSAGVRGLRVGAGPRGNYVHVGRHGVYYRAAIPSSQQPTSFRPPSSEENHLKEIDSAAISQMTDSSSAELLTEFDRKRKKTRLAPPVAVIGFILSAVLLSSSLSMPGSNAPKFLLAVALVGTVGAFWLAKNRDELAKTVVLFYDLEPDAEREYQQLHDGFAQLQGCGGTWHLEARAEVGDRKRQAGASSVVRRKLVRLTRSSPPFVKTNVEVPSIPVGRQTLYWFPDRLLVFDSNGVGAIPYEGLKVERRSTRFIEEGTVPSDAKVVGHTWRYVNKKGGPDRRFSNNRELPIALYEEIALTSSSGLNELLQVSRLDAGQAFEKAVKDLGLASKTLPEAAKSTT